MLRNYGAAVAISRDRNYLSANHAHTVGEIAFNAAIQIEGAEVEVDTWLLWYIRTFEILNGAPMCR